MNHPAAPAPAPAAIAIRLNGRPARVAPAPLGDLLAAAGIDPERRRLAIAHNGTVVPRAQWSATMVHDGDDVEVIGAVQGG